MRIGVVDGSFGAAAGFPHPLSPSRKGRGDLKAPTVQGEGQGGDGVEGDEMTGGKEP